MKSAWCALLQDIELMPQYQDFGFQPPPRKQSHSTQTKRKPIAIMRRSSSDSLLTASQVDGVFGTGKVWAHDLTGAGNVVVALLAFRPDLTKEGQRTIQSSQGLSRLTGPWKVCFLECLQGVILRNKMHHLEAARWHTDLVLKREKQADSIGRRAAAVLASAGQVPMKLPSGSKTDYRFVSYR
jgi:hypothetical protein